MINYIKGKIIDIYRGFLVIECNGIGYEIFVPESSNLYTMKTAEDVKVYTYMSVREDDISLYGFEDRESLRVFKLLISVNGIGAKVAMAILSALNSQEIKKTIVLGESEYLTKAPGVGKKTAKRIVLELADKFKDDMGLDIDNLETTAEKQPILIKVEDETVEALISLGYMKQEARDAVKSVSEGEKESVENCLRASLKILAKN